MGFLRNVFGTTDAGAKKLQPEDFYITEITDKTVQVSHPKRAVEAIDWDEIEAIKIMNTDEGPFLPDVWLLLIGKGKECSIPHGSDGWDKVYEIVSKYEGFNFDNVIESASCTENKVFDIWKKKMKKFGIYSLMFLGMLSVPNIAFSQNEPKNDVVTLDDGFQDIFFDAVQQRSIENYDKAITALEKGITIEPENPIVYFELGKNYFAQKKYQQAYDNYEKVTKMDPNNRWAWVGMYDVCYETKDYNKAIPIVEKLVTFKEDYKEDLTSLYMNTQQFDKALTLINELNEKFGKTDKRELYKADILKDAKYQSSEKFNLLEQIKKFPKEESNYIDLIYMYSQSNQEEKALEVAQKLEKEIPTSDWAKVSLFKFHLNNNDGDNAVKDMNIVFPSKKIDSKIKHRMLNEFLIFTRNNPKYEPDLDKAIGYFDNDKEVKVAKEIGKFYYAKSNWAQAIKYFEMHLKNAQDDVETQILLMQSYTENQQFDILAKKSDDLTQLFPTQPQFYYYDGLANNQLKNFKKGASVLESGIDFVVDDQALEINFNIQLGEAYNGLGDAAKKEKYFTKANELIKKQKK